MATLNLNKPLAATQQAIAVTEEITDFTFAFDIADAILERTDDDALLISFDDDSSSILLEDFYSVYSSEFMPNFLLDGVMITGDDFFAALDENLMPAAGPATDSVNDGGRFYDSDINPLAAGIDLLGGLDGGSAYSVEPLLVAGAGNNIPENANISPPSPSPAPSPNPSPNPSPEPSPSPNPNPSPNPEPAPNPNPEPTPTPTPVTLTLNSFEDFSLKVYDKHTYTQDDDLSDNSFDFAEGIISSLEITPPSGVTVTSTVVTNFGLTIENSNTGMTCGGDEITLEVDPLSGDVIGVANGEEVFRLSISDDGTLSMTLSKPVDHTNSSDPNEIFSNFPENTVSVNATVTVTDSNNLSASEDVTLDLGGKLHFEDHGPTVDVLLTKTPQAETVYNGVPREFNFSDYFETKSDYGADGKGTLDVQDVATLKDAAGNTILTVIDGQPVETVQGGISTGVFGEYNGKLYEIKLYPTTDDNGNFMLKGSMWGERGATSLTITFTENGVVFNQYSTLPQGSEFDIKLNLSQNANITDFDNDSASDSEEVNILAKDVITLNTSKESTIIVQDDVLVEGQITGFTAGTIVVGAKLWGFEASFDENGNFTGDNNGTFTVDGNILTVNSHKGVYKVDLTDGSYTFTYEKNGNIHSNADSYFDANGEKSLTSDGFSIIIKHPDGTEEMVSITTTLYDSVFDIGSNNDSVLGDGNKIAISGDITTEGIYKPGEGGNLSNNNSKWNGHDVIVGDKGGSADVVVSDYNFCYVLDNSGSIGNVEWDSMINAVIKNIQDILASDAVSNARFGITCFDHEGNPDVITITVAPDGSFTLEHDSIVNSNLTADDLLNYFKSDHFTTANWTNFHDAFDGAKEWFDSLTENGTISGENKLVFITDGSENQDTNKPNDSFKELTDANGKYDVDVSAVQVGSGGGWSHENLQKYDSDGSVLHGDYSDLEGILNDAIIKPLENPSAAGDDSINAGTGDDIIFGDALNADYMLSDEFINANKGFSTEGLEKGDSFEIVHAYLDYKNGGSSDNVSADEFRDFVKENYKNLSTSGYGGGNDNLEGGAGNDIIFGQAGDDIINGGSGNDEMYGGAGNNTFVWELNSLTNGEVDTIYGSDEGINTLDLTAFKNAGYTLEANNNSGSVELTLSSSDGNSSQTIVLDELSMTDSELESLTSEFDRENGTITI